MNYEDIKLWCHNEMRAPADSDIYRRAKTILVAVEAASAPTWLSDAAEALGMVRPSDGAPMALNWTQVIQHIRELREDRDTLLKISAIVNGAFNKGSCRRRGCTGSAVLMNPKIPHAQRACEAAGARQAVVVWFNEAGQYAVASYGETKAECTAIAPLSDAIADAIDGGDLPSPARRALTAIAETIGERCSICRRRHGAEVQHAAE